MSVGELAVEASVADACAVLAKLPVVVGSTWTTTAKVTPGGAVTGKLGSLQLTLVAVEPAQLQFTVSEGVTDTSVVPAGRASLRMAFTAASGPLLDRPSV